MYNTKKIDIYSGIYQPDPYTKPSEKIMREKPWDNDEQRLQGTTTLNYSCWERINYCNHQFDSVWKQKKE